MCTFPDLKPTGVAFVSFHHAADASDFVYHNDGERYCLSRIMRGIRTFIRVVPGRTRRAKYLLNHPFSGG